MKWKLTSVSHFLIQWQIQWWIVDLFSGLFMILLDGRLHFKLFFFFFVLVVKFQIMIPHNPLSYSKTHILKPEGCFLTGSMEIKMKVFSRHIWLENDEMTLGKMKKFFSVSLFLYSTIFQDKVTAVTKQCQLYLLHQVERPQALKRMSLSKYL